MVDFWRDLDCFVFLHLGVVEKREGVGSVFVAFIFVFFAKFLEFLLVDEGLALVD